MGVMTSSHTLQIQPDTSENPGGIQGKFRRFPLRLYPRARNSRRVTRLENDGATALSVNHASKRPKIYNAYSAHRRAELLSRRPTIQERKSGDG